MLEVTITTSMQTLTFVLTVPVDDKIELHYDGCAYCNETFRKESILSKIGTPKERKFCLPKHRSLYHEMDIAHANA